MPSNRKGGPEVVGGLRSPADRAQRPQVPAQLAELSEKVRDLVRPQIPKVAGERVFHSRYRKYRIQITAPADRINPSTGVIEKARPVVAKFDDFEFRVKPSHPHFAMVCERIEAMKTYGVEGEVWDAEMYREVVNERNLAHMVDAIQTQPKLLSRLLKDLGIEKDFKLPTPDQLEKAGKSAAR